MTAVAHKPDLAEDEIRRWLWENYSIDGSLEPLPGERDLNFKCCVEGGGSVVCKISSGSEDLEFLAAQTEVMALLNQRDLAAVPNILASNRGVFMVPLIDGGREHVGRVLTFVAGRVLARCAPYGVPLLRSLGRTVGQLDRALLGYDNPAFHHKFDWDLAHAMEVVGRCRELLPSSRLRDGVDRIRREFADLAVPRFGQLRKSVIHNDANDHNVLADGDRVTGLIDFGDMVHTYTICDLAIAVAYAILGAEDIPLVVKEVATGYHESMPLEDAELGVLFPMVRMRLALSACMAAHQMRLRPGDPYLSISQEPIRRTLPRLLALDGNEVHAMLKESLA